MAHFAKLNEENIVESVIVISNDVAVTEQAGIGFINDIYHTNDVWVQTSKNTNAGVHNLGGTAFRKNYASIGYTFDKARDAFIPIKPFPSWILDEETCQWNAPTAMPDDGKSYSWNESTKAWDEIVYSG